MKDIEGNVFQVGDWLRGDDQFGKVTSISADSLVYTDEDGNAETLTAAEVEEYNVILYHYSSIRRRSLANQLPADILTTEEYEGAYDRSYWFQDLVAECADDAGKDLTELEENGQLPSNYFATVQQALADNEDQDGFVSQLTSWFATL